MSSIERIVIVGGGLAAARAAEAIRQEGYEGSITILGDEPERPYLRPPLSKEYLRGESVREKVYVHPATFYEERRIALRPSTAVTAIEPASREVVVEDGERVPYDRLLVATGAQPRMLPMPGAELPGVMTLRTVADADAIRAAATDAERVVVVGAGWIGSEVAASLRMVGQTVALISPESVPLERVLGPDVGGAYRDLHLEHGVDWWPGTRVQRIIGTDRVQGVETLVGERIAADLVDGRTDRGRPRHHWHRRPAADRTRGRRRPSGRRWHRSECEPRDVGARDLRRRGRRIRLASLLWAADPNRALGEREIPGRGRRPSDARRVDSV
jgi:3-phenylpropionate/trans-cinnamate dioxygenase ferredoxin reductase subunit